MPHPRSSRRVSIERRHTSPPFLGVDVAARPNLDPPAARAPGPAQDAGQIVLIHEVAIPCPAILVQLLGVFLLVLGQDQLSPPTILATALDVGSLAAC